MSKKYQVTVLNENIVFDAFMLFHFLKRLTTPFEKTKAFQLGIIDAQGKVLKKRSQLRTTEEKKAFGLFDVLVFNLKKILEKIPFGRSRLASFAAALFLLREQQIGSTEDDDLHSAHQAASDFEHYVNDLDDEDAAELRHVMRELGLSVDEDVVVNVAGSGEVAGLGDGTTVVKKRPKKQPTGDGKRRLSFREHISSDSY